MTIWYRIVSIKNKNKFFLLSFVVYGVVALVGLMLALASFRGVLPSFPSGSARWYLIGEGILIPLSWLAQFKLLTLIGAANIAIAQTINFVTVALFGFLFLGDTLSSHILLGGTLLIAGVIIAFSIKRDEKIKKNAPLVIKVGLLLVSSLSLAGGLMFEKLAIDSISVWSYSFYGWGMQFVGAAILLIIFGRKEIAKTNSSFWPQALIAGLLTALAGALFIFSLSKGLLSVIILAASAKVALTSILAIWLLKERNNIKRRILAISVTITGLIIIFNP